MNFLGKCMGTLKNNKLVSTFNATTLKNMSVDL